jgi:hypothetical protein
MSRCVLCEWLRRRQLALYQAKLRECSCILYIVSRPYARIKQLPRVEMVLRMAGRSEDDFHGVTDYQKTLNSNFYLSQSGITILDLVSMVTARIFHDVYSI